MDIYQEKLIKLYLKAETDIINEIGRLRSLGLVDYHAEAALDRVQAILRKLEGDGWEYVPRMIERQFYVSHPQAREPSARGETPEKHLAGYKNAAVLTGEQTDIVQRLTMNLMGELTEAHATVYSTLSSALIGRTEPDVLRRVGLEQTGLVQAAGRGVFRAVPDFVEALRREGWQFLDTDARERFLLEWLPEFEELFDLLTDFRFGGYRVLPDILLDIDQENTSQDRKRLTRDGDSPAFAAMMEAYQKKTASQSYRDAVSTKCRELLDEIVKPVIAVRYVVALGKRGLLWELLPDTILPNVLEVRHAE